MILVLAGPPAVGHNTVAERVCRSRPRSALVDIDELLPFVISPATDPDGSIEWDRQYRLAVRIACAVATNFDREGFDVVIVDVVEPQVLPLYRSLLTGIHDLAIVLLTASPDTLLARDRDRDPDPSPDSAALLSWHNRIRDLHARLTAHSDLYDLVIDSTNLDANQTTEAVNLLMPTSS